MKRIAFAGASTLFVVTVIALWASPLVAQEEPPIVSPESTAMSPVSCRVETRPQPIAVVHLRLPDEGDGRGSTPNPDESEPTAPTVPGSTPDGDAGIEPTAPGGTGSVDLGAQLGDGFEVRDWTIELPVGPEGTDGGDGSDGGESTDDGGEERFRKLDELMGDLASLFDDPTPTRLLIVYEGDRGGPLGVHVNEFESSWRRSRSDEQPLFSSMSVEGIDGEALRGAYRNLGITVADEGSDGNPEISIDREEETGGTDQPSNPKVQSWSARVAPAPERGTTWTGGNASILRIEVLDDETGDLITCRANDDATVGLPARIEVDDGGAARPWRVRITSGDGTAVHLAPALAVGGVGDDLGATSPKTPKPDASSPPVGVSSSSPVPVVLAAFGGLLVGVVAVTLVNRREPAMSASENYGVMGVGPQPPGHLPGPGPVPGGPVVDPRPSFRPTANPEPSLPVRPQPAPPGWTGTVHGDRAIRLGELGLSRLRPRDRESGRTWAYEAAGVQAVAGWMEKQPGRGEDAEPTLRVHESGSALLGVYDGTGGAGAAIARRLRDGSELTGAYVASRLVRELVETWAIRRLGQGPVGDPEEARAVIAGALRDEATVLPDSGGMRGSLSKKLPTTAAVVAVTVGAEGIRTEAIWAGDSRAFVLTPDRGLQVLTVDDTLETDALELIRNDQPMQNLISADKPFRLHRRVIDHGPPMVHLVATDGCFGYVATPAHFEFHLLDTLEQAANVGEWADRLLDRLAAIAADDVSFSIVASGHEDFASLKAAFTRRHRQVLEEHWAPFDDAREDPEALERLRIWSWHAYRPNYEALLSETPEEF